MSGAVLLNEKEAATDEVAVRWLSTVRLRVVPARRAVTSWNAPSGRVSPFTATEASTPPVPRARETSVSEAASCSHGLVEHPSRFCSSTEPAELPVGLKNRWIAKSPVPKLAAFGSLATRLLAFWIGVGPNGPYMPNGPYGPYGPYMPNEPSKPLEPCSANAWSEG